MNPAAMVPHGLALAAYSRGESDAQLVVRREDGVEELLPVCHFFREPPEFSPIEVTALDCCRGCVLDIGAGTGLHGLYLESQGHSVTAIDISPEAVAIMTERGLGDVHCVDIFDYRGGPFDTLLMLGHGIGVVEDVPGLARFLNHARQLARSDGQLLVHSLDVQQSEDPRHLVYHDTLRQAGRYVGEVRLQFEYEGRSGPFCGWLHVDLRTLRRQAGQAGWTVEALVEAEGGEYLARLGRTGTV